MPHSNDQATVSKELFLKLPSLRPLSLPFLLVGHLSRQHAKDTRAWRPERAQPCLVCSDALLGSQLRRPEDWTSRPEGVLRSQTRSPLSPSAAFQHSQGRNGLVLLKRPPPCGIPRSGFVSSSVTKQTEDLNGSTSKSIFFGWTVSEETDQRGWKGLRGWLITAGTWGFGVGMEGDWGLLAGVSGAFLPTPPQGQFRARLWISAALSSPHK